MSFIRGPSPLTFRRLGRAELDAVAALEFDPDQVTRFLGPVADIQAAVQRGPAHSMIAIEALGALVGFYVIYPDPRDGTCWWLGWLALDLRQQGRGYGSLAMLAVLQRLRRLAECRRIRLLVAPENSRARGLYDRAGFRCVGRLASTGELVLELAVRSVTDAGLREAFVLAIIAAGARQVFRHRRLRLAAGPHAAWVIGVERGPPVPRAVGAAPERRRVRPRTAPSARQSVHSPFACRWPLRPGCEPDGRRRQDRTMG